MSKRKITDQQRRRIQKIQDIRINRAQKSAKTAEDLVASNALGAEQHGLLISHFGTSVDIEGIQGEIFRCHLRQNLGYVVVGDKVIWRAANDQTGVVVAIEPRSSELLRPDPLGVLKPVAANIEQIFLVLAPEPEPSEYLVDRYLVAAESLHIPVLIVINKWDLLNLEQQQHFLQRFSYYQQIGYPLFTVSATQLASLENLKQHLQQHTNIFVGQSGVGKSSLLNAVLPNENAKVGAISTHSGLGQHTTSTSRLYHLPFGGQLIDSPGIREFDLWHSNPQDIFQGFREFRPYTNACKFRNCAHQHEPECAILQAVAEQKIDSRRLESYHRLIKDC